MKRNWSYLDLDNFFRKEGAELFCYEDYRIGKRGRIEGGYAPTRVTSSNLMIYKYSTHSNRWFLTMEECEDSHDSSLERLSRRWPLKIRKNYKRKMSPRGRKRYTLTTKEEDDAIEWYNTFSEDEKLKLRMVIYILES